MTRQKYLINLNHYFSFKSMDEYSMWVDGIYVSSCHLKKDKLLKLISSKEVGCLPLYIDFFHYAVTSEINYNDAMKLQMQDKVIDEIWIEDNLVKLIILNQTKQARDKIEQAILAWIDLVNNSNQEFHYAIPLPMIQKGEIYQTILDMYKDILIANKSLIKDVQKFAHIVLKVGDDVDEKNLSTINEIISQLDIKDVFLSIWRKDDVLLSNQEELEKINWTINQLIERDVNIYLNYLHNELFYFQSKQDKPLNYVLGTFDQTKVLSPNIKWMSEPTNIAKLPIYIFEEDYCVSFRYDLKLDMINLDMLKGRKLESMNTKISFMYNTKTMIELLQSDCSTILNNVIKKLNNVANNESKRNMFAKAAKYSLKDYLDVYESALNFCKHK